MSQIYKTFSGYTQHIRKFNVVNTVQEASNYKTMFEPRWRQG